MSRLTVGVTAVAVLTLAGLAAAAPVPPAPPPDPLAKGFLGVTFQGDGLVIGDVQPNLPAAKAGIRPGDKIVRIGTARPQVFDQVVAQVCSYRPGAVIEVEVERGTERKVFKVTLTARDPDLGPGTRVPPIDPLPPR